MAISTKNIPTSGSKQGGGQKKIQPGNCVARILAITLENYPFREGAQHLVLHLETTTPDDDFEGFFLDKDKPEKGKYIGQVGYVRASQYAFEDGKTKSGIPVMKDIQIMKFLNSLCEALEIQKWFQAQDNKFETIEEFVQAMDKARPYRDKYLKWCIAGKERQNKGGYKDYYLHLPKFSADGYPFESLNADPSKLAVFNPAKHIIVARIENVSEFGNSTDVSSAPSEFDLDNED